jgi:UDP-N-acetyl-D-mannosaminuronic acid transferase (WecB/TagA/CpsF family)
MYLTKRLFQWDKKQALTQIERIYREQGFAIVSYVYGAVIVRNKLLESSPYQKHKWHDALFGSSIILPDGAALRLWRRIAHRVWKVSGTHDLSNLNGTDFFPYLLEEYLKIWPINLVCYGTYGWNLSTQSGDVIIPAGEWLQQYYWITWSYWQDIDYHDTTTQRNRDEMTKHCDPNYPTIMMVCLWVPRQELWSYNNRDKLKQYWIIACNQWATIDYWAWRESRAPRLVRKIWLESVWRLISDPRKNWSKFWVSFQMMGEIVKLFF